MRHLEGVVVAQHVISENHVTLPRQTYAQRGSGVERLILQPPIRPVALRIQYPGMLRPPVARTIQIAAEIETRQRLQEDFLDGVLFRFDLAEALRMKRSLLRQGREPGVYQNLFAQNCL